MFTSNWGTVAVRLVAPLALTLWLVLAAVTSAGVLSAAGPTFTVDSTGDSADDNPGDGVCDDGTGKCTLRAAIEESNASSTTSTIAFNIPTTDPGYQATTTSFRIRPTSSLPTITSPLTIDGYTQPGASANTNGPGLALNTVLKIELSGDRAGIADGLRITAGITTVRGLAINRFGCCMAVVIESNGGNVIEGNFIGTDVRGTTSLGNSQRGVHIVDTPNNMIGGILPEARNIISGNRFYGVQIAGDDAHGNLIQGNFIGTDVTGSIALGNSQKGVDITNAPNNTIGGTVAEARNIISGNGHFGVRIVGNDATGNQVQGNYIGTDVNRTVPLGNTLHGVNIFDASGNTVGGMANGAGNTIAFNHADGVFVSSLTGNGVLSNSILSNTGLGIDLSPNGVTANDEGDVDSGPNNLQNFPVITSALIEKGDLLIQYSVDSVVGSSAYPLMVQFFIADADGQEGKTYLGSDTYASSTAQSTKVANLGSPFALGLKAGDVIVATATDAAGNTSEFSLATTATTVTSVPALAPWTLVVVAGLFAALVAWRRRLARPGLG